MVHPWDETNLVMVFDLLKYILSILHKSFIEKLKTCIHQGNWSTFLRLSLFHFSVSVSLLIWFWYPANVGSCRMTLPSCMVLWRPSTVFTANLVCSPCSYGGVGLHAFTQQPHEDPGQSQYPCKVEFTPSPKTLWGFGLESVEGPCKLYREAGKWSHEEAGMKLSSHKCVQPNFRWRWARTSGVWPTVGLFLPSLIAAQSWRKVFW